MRAALDGNQHTGSPSSTLQTVQVPLVVAGLDTSVSAPLIKRLRSITAAPLQAVAGGGYSSGTTPERLVNGGALAVVMAKGDINLFV